MCARVCVCVCECAHGCVCVCAWVCGRLCAANPVELEAVSLSIGFGLVEARREEREEDTQELEPVNPLAVEKSLSPLL